MAMRAGLDVSDVEFVQFHPTVMWSGPDAAGQQALVSEAVRGEGAILYDGAGRRVMAGVHPQEDLAPRDVVAAAISRTHGGGAGRCRRPRVPRRDGDGRAVLRALSRRSPRRAASIGVDPARERIPVAPAAHYACGGVPARLDGTTALAGPLRRRRGVLHRRPRRQPPGVEQPHRECRRRHAARPRPRLGAAGAGGRGRGEPTPATAGLVDPAHKVDIRTAMSRHAGVLRDAAGLADAATRSTAITRPARCRRCPPSQAAYEATNVATVARALLAAAAARTESRGCHRRSDHPEPRPEWVTHLHVGLAASPDAGPVDRRRRSAPDRSRRRRIGAMLMFHPLSPATRERLIAGGLDPDAVAALGAGRSPRI